MLTSAARRVLLSGVKVSRTTSLTSAAIASRSYGSLQSTSADCHGGHVRHQQCWNCDKFLSCIKGKFFCGECQVIQPPPECVNFFQFFNLPISFDLSASELTQKYRNLQRELHPDRFSSKSSKELSLAEEQSSTVNRAYQTLLRPLSRAIYLLELAGVADKEDSEVRMESDFLSDMFELNEAIMEENSPEVIKRIGSENRVKIQQLEAQLGANFKQNDYEAAKKSVAELKYYINVEKIVNTKLGLE